MLESNTTGVNNGNEFIYYSFFLCLLFFLETSTGPIQEESYGSQRFGTGNREIKGSVHLLHFRRRPLCRENTICVFLSPPFLGTILIFAYSMNYSPFLFLPFLSVNDEIFTDDFIWHFVQALDLFARLDASKDTKACLNNDLSLYNRCPS
jgi:hypothetical protein